jgi:formylglycine-generating enzyme required for sulfatase activity
MTTFDFKELDRAMVRIPRGKGILGLTPDQKAAFARQTSVHPDMLRASSDVLLTETSEFWIDRYPVTRAQFRRFQKATGYKIPENGWLAGWAKLTGWHEDAPEKDGLPMVGLNAADAAAYAAWCGKRLPTDAEWERAWRGYDGRLFPWGDAWQDGFAFRSPGSISLQPTQPVGAFGDIGPFGLGSYGLVLEWVISTGARHNDNVHALAGGSFLHTREYSFLPSYRSHWHDSMRMYNTGFRCVADLPPTGADAALRCPARNAALPTPVSMRPEVYGREPIRLRPTDHATVLIEVPWFPQSLWVLDCPEETWGDFGGANAWPHQPREKWLIPWTMRADKNSVIYTRKQDERSQVIEVWAEGTTLHYRYQTSHLEAIKSSFCFKSFSPFFTSQEQRVQCVLEDGRLNACDTMPRQNTTGINNGWSVGEVKPPARCALVSFDGKGRILLPERTQQVGGNGFYPCIHVTADDDTAREGGGSFEFAML